MPVPGQVDVLVVLAGAEPRRALAAHLDDLVEQRAGTVLRIGVALAEPEAAPVIGDDVGDAVLGAGDLGGVAGHRFGGGGSRCGGGGLRVGGDARRRRAVITAGGDEQEGGKTRP
jgi:hypothetical protein